jgi:hypothetical protein
MTLALHCDREGCDTWQNLPASLWIVVSNPDGRNASHFCTLDCMMHWAADNSVPTVTV